jgi:LacI family transcriptional regulator
MSRPTLAQVAELAGVSLKTASRAMNDEYGVAPATAERVLEAARSLGFRPNSSRDRWRRGGRARPSDLSSPMSRTFFAELVGGVERTLAPRDLRS